MLRFWKVEAIANDFPLIRLEDVSDGSLPDLAISMCERHFGVGGDGLLAVGMEDGDLRLRMFNPDGTEDFCGNGLRCAARWAHAEGWVGDAFTIRHLDRLVATRIEGHLVSTEIGPASYEKSRVPIRLADNIAEHFRASIDLPGGLKVVGSALTTGSTHFVIDNPAPQNDLFDYLSPLIENASIFPNRTSVIWSKVVEPMVLKVRIWERGVGETLGCGTGSAAAAVDYLRGENRGGRVEVRNPGGTIWVTADSWDAPLVVTGEAAVVYAGEFSVP